MSQHRKMQQTPSSPLPTKTDDTQSIKEEATQDVEEEAAQNVEEEAAQDVEEEAAQDVEEEATQDAEEPASGMRSARDVAHWSWFGRRGRIQRSRCTGLSWEKKEDFKLPHTIPWVLALSPAQLGRLLHGITPRAMEDKWFIFADGPYANRSAKINFHRSWTGQKVAQLMLELSWGDDDAANPWEGKVVELTIEGADDDSDDSDAEDSSATNNEKSAVQEQNADGGEEDETVQDSLESIVKFQVLEACRWVLGIQLIEEIQEPKSWERLKKMPIVMMKQEEGEEAKPLYRGVTMSEETMEDFERIGFGMPFVLN